MKWSARSFQAAKPIASESKRVKTTLIELIEAVSEEVNADEEKWIPLIVHGILSKLEFYGR